MSFGNDVHMYRLALGAANVAMRNLKIALDSCPEGSVERSAFKGMITRLERVIFHLRVRAGSGNSPRVG